MFLLHSRKYMQFSIESIYFRLWFEPEIALIGNLKVFNFPLNKRFYHFYMTRWFLYWLPSNFLPIKTKKTIHFHIVLQLSFQHSQLLPCHRIIVKIDCKEANPPLSSCRNCSVKNLDLISVRIQTYQTKMIFATQK